MERMIGNGRRASEVISRLRALARKSNPSHAVLTLNDIVADVFRSSSARCLTTMYAQA